MAQHQTDREVRRVEGGDVSLFSIATAILRWRYAIALLTVLGGLFGATRGLMTPEMYETSATFVPRASESTSSALATAASQFGVRLPASGGGWALQMYVQLLKSRALLERIAMDSIDVLENGRRRQPLPVVLGIDEPVAAKRLDATVKKLRQMVNPWENTALGSVSFTVTSPSPSVSLGIAELLVREVDEFNIQTRRAQAAAERQFVETQADQAQRALRDAESRLQAFLQRNRGLAGSPSLSFERDRLTREVMLRQQLATSWAQNREEAKIREIRDTPVITVFEEPLLPMDAKPRRVRIKAILGAFGGFMLGLIGALLAYGFARATRRSTPGAREFLRQLRITVPGALKRTA